MKDPRNKFKNDGVVLTGHEIFHVEETQRLKDAISINLIEKVPAYDLPPNLLKESEDNTEDDGMNLSGTAFIDPPKEAKLKK